MTTISREQLFDLVWTQPRTALAERFGISDVALGKLCVREQIPMPARGYWARVAVGKTGRQPPLPTRWPGANLVLQVGAPEPWKPISAHDVPPEPPRFVETVDAQVEHAMKAYSPEAEKRRLSSPHAALRQVLASEARRRSKPAVYGVLVDQPKFDAPHFQAQLKILNALAYALTSVRARCEVRSHSKWEDGKGEQNKLSLTAMIGDPRLTFVFEPEPRFRGKPAAREAPYQPVLILEASRAGDEPDRWQTRPELPLEKQLRQITAVALTRAEQRLRAAEVHKHAHVIARIEEEQQRAEAARLEGISLANDRAAAESRTREEALKTEANRWHQAEQLRAYVAAVTAKHPDSVAWQAWALSVADGMDPLMSPDSTTLGHFDATQ